MKTVKIKIIRKDTGARVDEDFNEIVSLNGAARIKLYTAPRIYRVGDRLTDAQVDHLCTIKPYDVTITK